MSDDSIKILQLLCFAECYFVDRLVMVSRPSPRDWRDSRTQRESYFVLGECCAVQVICLEQQPCRWKLQITLLLIWLPSKYETPLEAQDLGVCLPFVPNLYHRLLLEGSKGQCLSVEILTVRSCRASWMSSGRLYVSIWICGLVVLNACRLVCIFSLIYIYKYICIFLFLFIFICVPLLMSVQALLSTEQELLVLSFQM